jgi:hypothetical protein
MDLLATLIGAVVTKPYAFPEAGWQPEPRPTS